MIADKTQPRVAIITVNLGINNKQLLVKTPLIESKPMIKITPNNLTGESEFTENFFSKIDEIED